MKNRAFTLIELAIVLSIIGFLIGGGFKIYKMQRQKAYAKEAKSLVEAAKEAIVGYSLEYVDLPTWSEFAKDLSPVKGKISDLNKTFFYFADPSLQNDKDICTFDSTDLEVDVYQNGSLDHTIKDVAFVVAAQSANHNIQTYYSYNSSTGKYVVKVYDSGEKVDDNPQDYTRKERYDDIVKWVSLSQLQNEVKCFDNKLVIINNYSLPRYQSCDSASNEQCYLGVGVDDNVKLIADKGYPYSDDSDQNGKSDSDSDTQSDYLWCAKSDLAFADNFSISCGSSDDIVGTSSGFCDDIANYHQCTHPILDSKKGKTLDAGSYSFTIFAKDKKSTKSKTFNIVIDAKISTPSSSGGSSSSSSSSNTGNPFWFKKPK